MSALETILRDLPGHVAAELKALLPDLRTARATTGRFDLGRLSSEGIAAPAVLVSILRLAHDEEFAGDHHGFLLHMGCFIVTTNAMGQPADATAATIAQAILSRVAGTDWGLEDCGEVRDLKSEPIVSQGTLSAKASLWVVHWRQPVAFEAIVPNTTQVRLFVAEGPEAEPADYVEIGGGS